MDTDLRCIQTEYLRTNHRLACSGWASVCVCARMFKTICNFYLYNFVFSLRLFVSSSFFWTERARTYAYLTRERTGDQWGLFHSFSWNSVILCSIIFCSIRLHIEYFFIYRHMYISVMQTELLWCSSSIFIASPLQQTLHVKMVVIVWIVAFGILEIRIEHARYENLIKHEIYADFFKDWKNRMEIERTSKKRKWRERNGAPSLKKKHRKIWRIIRRERRRKRRKKSSYPRITKMPHKVIKIYSEQNEKKKSLS